MGLIEDRLPVWIAISEFYLDTELQEEDYDHIFRVMKASGMNIAELKEIDLYEVFPTLQGNLNSVAGEWAGFNEEWLKEVCSKNAEKRKRLFFRIIINLRNKGAYWMRKDHWREIELRFNEQTS